jgi:Gpi18-like mannosyltransferase
MKQLVFLRSNSGWFLGNLFLIIFAFGLFLTLSYPGNTQRLSVERVKDFSDLASLNQIEHDAAGQPSVWTKGKSYFVFESLPRFLPLTITVEMSLNRPAGEPPAHLNVNEVDSSRYGLVQPITSFDFVPDHPGFQQYTLQIPALTDLQTGLVLQFDSNAFRVDGDGRLLGVAVRGFTIATNGDHWSGLVAPYQMGVAVGLLLIVLAVWFRLARLGWLESAVFLVMLVLTAAEQVQFLRVYSWWLLGGAGALALCAVGWWLTHRRAGPAGFARFEIYWVFAGMLLLMAFFLPADDFSFDTNLYRDWIDAVMRYGPFDFYSHSDTFNYLPLIIYIFWVYGHLTSLVGLTANMLYFRIFMSLLVLACSWLIYRLLRPTENSIRPVIIPVIMLFGFNLTTIYNPTIWGQADVLLALLLLVAYALIRRGYSIPAAIMLGISILFKPQAIFVAPLLALVLLKQAGWKKTGLGLGLSALICTALALPSFGFRWSEIHRYIFQEQLAGSFVIGSIRAYNVPYIFDRPEQLAAVTNIGLGIVALTFGAIGWYIWKSPANRHYTLAMGAALGVTAFFTFSIKMHERYLYYALPFLVLAVAYAWREQPRWLARATSWFTAVYSLIALLEMLVSRHVDLSGQIEENLFNWNTLLIQDRAALETGLSLAALGLYVWGNGLFWLAAWLNRKKEPEGEGELEAAAPPASLSLQPAGPDLARNA